MRDVSDSDAVARLRETLSQAGLPAQADPRQSLPRSTGRPLHEQETLDVDTQRPPRSSVAPLDSLPPLTVHEPSAGEPRPEHGFEVLRPIGHGGMGRVELARQPGLDRKVAIKRLRPDRTAEGPGRALIREARLMGGLEHPNIPPVHVLGRSDGEPVLAMKRIEGVSWAELLDDPDHPLGVELGADPLERHLEILLQVCQAVHFAHRHRTLHLDIKPDNVMVGRYGEVYLIDWGVAHSLAEIAEATASEDHEPRVVGTPAYMAPEMVRGLPGVSPATDVYLLGASLHHVLCGQPRHEADTALAALLQAELSEPYDYPEPIHPELAAVANRACHVDPSQRFESAQALRRALLDYLRLRSSLALGDLAQQRLERLRALAASASAAEPLPPELHDAFGECRVAFELALEKAAHNERAREGRRTAYGLMIDAELSARNAGAAQALMVQLGEPCPDRERALARLRERLADEAQAHDRLEAMERELRPRDDSWARTASTLVGSLAFLVLMGGMGLASRKGWMTITPTHNLVVAVALLIVGVLGSIVRRDRFLHNRIAVQISGLVIVTGMIMVSHRAVSVVLDLPLWQTALVDLAIMGMIFGAVELIIGKPAHALVMVGALGAATVGASLAPPHAYEIAGVVVATLNFKVAWDLRPELEVNASAPPPPSAAPPPP